MRAGFRFENRVRQLREVGVRRDQRHFGARRGERDTLQLRVGPDCVGERVEEGRPRDRDGIDVGAGRGLERGFGLLPQFRRLGWPGRVGRWG